MSFCPHCRQSNVAGMRFCRSCGKPLQTEPIEAAATQHLAVETGPAYLGPTDPVASRPMPARADIPPAPVKRRRGRWLLLFLIVFLAVGAGTAAALIWAFKRVEEKVKNTLPVYTPEVSTPTEDAAKTALKDLYYPGAVPESQIRQGENVLITLTSKDPVAKVISFYKGKLKNVNPIFQDGEGFAFAFEQGLVSGKQEGATTQILIAIKPKDEGRAGDRP